MADRKITDDELIQVIKDNPNLSNYKLGKKIGLHESSIRKRRKNLIKKGFSLPHGWTHTVPDGYKIKGVSSYVDSAGNIKAQWVKSTEDRERQLEIIQQTIESFTSEIPKISPVIVPENDTYLNHLLAVLPLGDPHIGMLAWAEECGANWDLKIAEETFCKLFYILIKSAPKCHKVVIENLGDYFHCDNMQGMTSRSGNILDVDGRYPKMVDVGIRILRFIIQICLEHFREVDIKNAGGNHDDIGGIWIPRLLAAAYENEPRVTVDVSSGPYMYTRFGNNLIGVHHGHTTKMPQLPGVMATDRRKDWGETEFQYWHTGHIHHDSEFRAREFPSCKVESFRTLAPNDAYATWGGWRSGQDSKCIIYHEKYGEVSRITKNIAEILD